VRAVLLMLSLSRTIEVLPEPFDTKTVTRAGERVILDPHALTYSSALLS
jgi:hypothetical protein